MKNNNKIILLMLILTLIILFAGYMIIRSQNNTNIFYNNLHLSVNMPIDDNDEYTKNLIKDISSYIEENRWGYISGSGPMYYQSLKSSYDIYINIQKDYVTKFRDYLNKYELARGSYLEVENKRVEEYGKLYGFMISYDNRKIDFSNIDTEITSLLGEKLKQKFEYIYDNKKYVYYYSEDKNTLESNIREYISGKKLTSDVLILQTSK